MLLKSVLRATFEEIKTKTKLQWWGEKQNPFGDPIKCTYNMLFQNLRWEEWEVVSASCIFPFQRVTWGRVANRPKLWKLLNGSTHPGLPQILESNATSHYIVIPAIATQGKKKNLGEWFFKNFWVILIFPWPAPKIRTGEPSTCTASSSHP